MLRPILSERNSGNHFLITSYDDRLRTVTVWNPFADDFNPKYLSLATNPVHDGFTCDYPSFKKNSFDGLHGGGYLTCAAFKVPLKPEKGRATAVFSVVVSDNEYSKELCAALADPDRAEQVFVSINEKTRAITNDVKINTPDTQLNKYINEWNTWQIVGSRLYSKSSIYQNGGAYGFRDQLQDASSLLLTKPEIMKKQIYRACAHQYEEGDVMHWFHTGMRKDVKKHKGVRTLCSDDLLWLPWSVSEYITATGDFEILNRKIPYLKSEPLSALKNERYENTELGTLNETVFDHCRRAIEMFVSRGRGEHNLPKILGGDWNDGFNRVGADGRGESVWLAWFASETLYKFSEICAGIGESEYSRHLESLARDLADAAGNAWDGEWFRRAYDDWGHPIGSKENDECKIDSIAQSFAWFCSSYGKAPEEHEKKQMALDSAVKYLADFDNKIVKLFTPPFTSMREYGYISAYPPGVRENGGQYTHAAVWLAMALFKAGKTELGYEILRILLPANHDEDIYEGEQFVIAADVYGYGELTGKCGWSWYTGAAGWYRRAVIESLLGITRRYNRLFISPNVPKHWPGFECVISYGASKYIIRAHNTGEKIDAETAFLDDGEVHEIDVFY
jgi:cyclic beta-1,2-glucan synthetase